MKKIKFSKAEKKKNRLRLLVYGAEGTGKTRNALQFPGVLLIDSDRGANWYADKFDFHSVETSDWEEINNIIDSLLDDPQDFKTIVIDSITHVYDALTWYYENRKKIETGKIDYKITPMDKHTINSMMGKLFDKLKSLDCNIICTAKIATSWKKSDKAGAFMEADGNKPEGYKSAAHEVDVVLELSQMTKKKFEARVQKDRTNLLPEKFVFNYENLLSYFGKDTIERDADRNSQNENLERKNSRRHETIWKEKTIKTAGITGEQIDKIISFYKTIGEEEVKEIIKDGFGVAKMMDLRKDEARLVISTLAEKNKEEIPEEIKENVPENPKKNSDNDKTGESK